MKLHLRRWADALVSAEVVALAEFPRRRIQCAAARGDDLGVEARAVFWRSDLRLEIHMHDAEALRVAEGPLEIVQERPDKVSAQIDPARNRGMNRPDVLVEIVHSKWIRDVIVLRPRRIEERRAVLGDVRDRV